MRRIAVMITVSALFVLLLGGCSGNLFMQWDQPSVPSANDISNRDVSDDSTAGSFISDVEDWTDADVLADDSGASDAVVSQLSTIYNDSTISDPVRKDAALLAGKVSLDSDPNATQLVDNITNVIADLADSSTTTDPETLMVDLVPDGALQDLGTFTDMVDTLLTSADAYLAYGDLIDPATADVSGDTVQRAATSVAVMAAIDALDGNFNGTADTSGSAISDLYTVLTDPNAHLSDYTAADPTDAFNTYTGAANILDAAGLSFS